MADQSDGTVTLQWSDHYSRSVGPPGARGESESGVTIYPELTAKPWDDAEVEVQVLKAVGSAGLLHREHTSSTRREHAQFDFGTTDAIVRALVAAGSAGAIASALKTGRAAWEA